MARIVKEKRIIINADGATHPDWVGGIGYKENEVEIADDQRSFLWDVFTTNSYVQSGIRLFLTNVMRGGLTIDVDVGGKQFSLNENNEEFRRYLTDEFLPNIEALLTDFLLYGYARIRYVPSLVNDWIPSFTVLREGLTRDIIIWDKLDRRSYKMVYRASVPNPSIGKEVPNGDMLFINHPDKDGNLTSPLAAVLTPLIYQKSLWQYFMRSSYHQSKVPYVFTPDAQLAKTDTAVIKTMNPRDMTLGKISTKQQNISRENYENALKSTRALFKRSVQHVSSVHGGSTDSIIDNIEREIPWEYGFKAPIGHSLQHNVVTTPPTQFIDVDESIARQIYRAIGVPPEMIVTRSARFAANIDAMNQELRTNIEEFQNKVKHILTTLVSRMWQKVFHGFISDRATKTNRNTDSKSLQAARDSVRVKVDFKYNPLISFELLERYLDRGVVSHKTFQEFALQLAGMPPELLDIAPTVDPQRQEILMSLTPNESAGNSTSSSSKTAKTSKTSSNTTKTSTQKKTNKPKTPTSNSSHQERPQNVKSTKN